MTEVLGIDGDYVNRDALVINDNEFMTADLGEHIGLNKRYDLAVSLEGAEHLSEEKSDTFVDNLIGASDHILFSAAVVGQGGDFHVNEQPLSYWKEKFHKKGYDMLDCLRPVIWNNSNILPMYRQNCVMFIKRCRDIASCISADNYIVAIENKYIASEVIKSLQCKYCIESDRIIYSMIPITRY